MFKWLQYVNFTNKKRYCAVFFPVTLLSNKTRIFRVLFFMFSHRYNMKKHVVMHDGKLKIGMNWILAYLFTVVVD